MTRITFVCDAVHALAFERQVRRPPQLFEPFGDLKEALAITGNEFNRLFIEELDTVVENTVIQSPLRAVENHTIASAVSAIHNISEIFAV